MKLYKHLDSKQYIDKILGCNAQTLSFSNMHVKKFNANLSTSQVNNYVMGKRNAEFLIVQNIVICTTKNEKRSEEFVGFKTRVIL